VGCLRDHCVWGVDSAKGVIIVWRTGGPVVAGGSHAGGKRAGVGIRELAVFSFVQQPLVLTDPFHPGTSTVMRDASNPPASQ
jgi:hypothetical protein